MCHHRYFGLPAAMVLQEQQQLHVHLVYDLRPMVERQQRYSARTSIDQGLFQRSLQLPILELELCRKLQTVQLLLQQ
jgi:hypothetical protein